MEKVFDNLINGNIYDAKKEAGSFGLIALALPEANKNEKMKLNEAQTKIQNAITGGCAGIKATIAGDRIQLSNGSKIIGFVTVSESVASYDFDSFALLKRAITSALNGK